MSQGVPGEAAKKIAWIVKRKSESLYWFFAVYRLSEMTVVNVYVWKGGCCWISVGSFAIKRKKKSSLAWERGESSNGIQDKVASLRWSRVVSGVARAAYVTHSNIPGTGCTYTNCRTFRSLVASPPLPPPPLVFRPNLCIFSSEQPKVAAVRRVVVRCPPSF